MQESVKEERRRYPRTQINWPVTIGTAEVAMVGETKNVSSGGVFICCEKPLAPNEIFNMSISIPERGSALVGKAEVIWTTRSGMGVMFHPNLD